VETALHTLDRAVAAGSAGRIARNLELRRAQRSRRRRAALSVLAASVLVGSFALWFARAPASAPLAASSSSAVVVAPVTQTLPDGSAVELKAGAEFTVEFGVTERRVVLRAGEAHFAVKKDPSRPFVVAAGGVEVRAVGTAFSVDFASRAVAVLVTEGRVAITAPAVAAAPGRSGLLDAGQRTVVAIGAAADAAPLQIARVTPAETVDLLAWRLRRLEFSATPLAEAIPMFNRHAGTRLALDPALGALRLSGALRADDLDALLLLLHGEFGIGTELQEDGTLLLRRR